MPKSLFSLSYSVDQNPELIWKNWQTTEFWYKSWYGRSQFFSLTSVNHKVPGALRLQPLLPNYLVLLTKTQPINLLEFIFSAQFHSFGLTFTLTGSNPTVLNVSAQSLSSQFFTPVFDFLARPYLRQYADRVADLCRGLVDDQSANYLDLTNTPPTEDVTLADLPSPGFFLWQLINHWQKQVDHVLKPYLLTSTQWLVLFELVKLNETDHDVSSRKLAKWLRINEVHLSDVLQTLVAKHLVHKLKLPNDGRKFRLTATSQGKLLAVEAHTQVIQAERKFFFALPAHDRQQFAKIITQFAKPIE